MADVSPATQAFDGVAPHYDDQFTEQQLGRWLRDTVWQQLTSSFQPGETVLDLGCGTGEDACFLASRGISVVATDVSAGMLAVAGTKAEARGVSDRVRLERLDLAHASLRSRLALLSEGRAFDGAYANFGPVNCLPTRRPLAEALATVVKPEGTVVVVVMGPICPWEIGWFLVHGHPRAATRRFRRGVSSHIGDAETRVWYPSPRRLRAEMGPEFVHVRTEGIGIFLPPSDLGDLVQRAPRVFAAAQAIDNRLRRRFPWTWLNDHYLSVFRRRSEA